MISGQPSRSAMLVAVARGTHRLWDAPPLIMDDPFALSLVGSDWEGFAVAIRGLFRPHVFKQGHAFLQIRSRYPEDRLLEGGHAQYVLLGAGLDSFAWRRPELLDRVTVFEVDHPATQAWKRERARALSLPVHAAHVFVPVDFETDDLMGCLARAGFDMRQPALFSWMGTTMYLGTNAVSTTLKAVATCARGSEIALSYKVTPEFMDDDGRTFLAAIAPKLAAQGEPVRSGHSPAEMEALISAAGLTVADHPTADELCARYCAGRTDGLRPYTVERLVTARRTAA